MSNSYFKKALTAPMTVAVFTYGLMSGNVTAAEDEMQTVAFADKYMFRIGAYVIDGASTEVSLNEATSGLGTIIDFQRDLGGEDSDTIPRIDAYYRFNERHRIDFTTFNIDRKGQRTLAIDLTIDGTDYSVSETLNSDIEYTLYKLGYNYSFYHSPKVELSISVGLNITNYDLTFSDSTGGKVETAGITAPLPVFGLRMGYAITPKWSIQYVAESFFIEIDDAFKGAIINYELNTEYRIFKNFAIGAGLARIALDADVNDDDWRGSITDSYRGFTAFGTFYF